METIPGFLSVPRLPGLSRPTGAFFSAVVQGPAGPGVWRIDVAGESLLVKTSLNLHPGQPLTLKLVGQTAARWEFQLVADPRGAAKESRSEAPALLSAFVSRGLPLAQDRAAAWARWLGRTAVSDKESWAASLEARGWGPSSAQAQDLSPWLAWQQALEEGRSGPPPEEPSWDEWNLKRPASGDPWLVLPLHWEYEGAQDSGLLQAHWSSQRAAIDRWQLTACPAGVPFRVEAVTEGAGLVLNWRFFQPAHAEWAKRWVTSAQLSLPDCPVSIRVTGNPKFDAPPSWEGIDVEV